MFIIALPRSSMDGPNVPPVAARESNWRNGMVVAAPCTTMIGSSMCAVRRRGEREIPPPRTN